MISKYIKCYVILRSNFTVFTTSIKDIFKHFTKSKSVRDTLWTKIKKYNKLVNINRITELSENMRERSLYDFDRKKLYEEVWKEPMVIVSKRYNLSDVGLKKICKKMNIPTPGNGHWTKVRAGIKVERPPLPKYNGPELANRPEYDNSFFNEIDRKMTEYSETRKFEKLKEEAENWKLAMTIRNYIYAVETRVLTMRIPKSEKTRILQKIKWAKQKADWLDPITATKDPILNKKLFRRLFFDDDI